jgi:double-stranded uracil-DNA glycosylase
VEGLTKQPAKRPTRAELLASAGKTIPNLVAPGLRILFVGINPGLYTAWAGHHFARPGNRFWPALHASGLTPRLLHPSEGKELLALGIGITGFVRRATATASELTADEYRAGGKRLRALVRRITPRCVVALGLTAYRVAFDAPDATLGRQPESIDGAMLWVLPNPSGLNAHFQPKDYARFFREVRLACVSRRENRRESSDAPRA